MSPAPEQGEVTTAQRTLALLNQQADEMRKELAELRQNLADAQHDTDEVRAHNLREANEHLVLSVLRADTIADKAVRNLGDLVRSSQRDVLTGTPNRALMLDRLENAIMMAQRHGKQLAVLFLDLDNFKEMNDTLGHAVGDSVLQLVARRLESLVRHSDTVSRYGGDEFLVLLSEVAMGADAAGVAAKILAALAAPNSIGDRAVSLSASIGIAIYPDDGEDATTLISGADAAMYRAKKRGPGNFEFQAERTAGDGPDRKTSAIAAANPGPVAQDLREANERLVVAAMTAQGLETQAREAHQRQVKFLAMVAHELRNPLTPLRTVGELLKHAHADDAMLDRLQAIIKRQVGHLTRLIEDLLDESRVSAGKFRLECSTVEMTHVFKLALDTCRPAMEARNQIFEMQLPAGPLLVHGDPVRLAQILSNLLDNASKYTGENGRIKLAAVKNERQLIISVSDTGIGIAAEVLPDVFGLFVQDARAAAVHGGGLGIGLAVVRELVEAHGGTVVAKSDGTDHGSEFIVTLPLLDVSEEESSHEKRVTEENEMMARSKRDQSSH